MIQEFADWLVYGLFGLSADTPIGVAVIWGLKRSDKIEIG